MRTIYLIIRQEVITLLGKRSFWITTIAFPALILLFNVGTLVLAGDAGGQEMMLGTDAGMQQLGYVDQGGVIRELPPGFPAEAFRPFVSVEAAEAALAAGQINMVAVLPADFAETGEMTLIQAEFSPFSNVGESLFSYLLAYNLTGDPALAGAIQGPLNYVAGHDIAPVEVAAEGETAGSGSAVAEFVPFIVLFIFFFLITMSSGYMLSSVSREKENRT
ncbi:MAG: ABC transporter permease, partial [Anaerolineae bacterium]|nr:ABC transporter permease [Anaerolineae bacterium]